MSKLLQIRTSLAKRILLVLVQHGTHEEFDWPGDAPESCGWWCDLCQQHIDNERHAAGHAPECPIEELRAELAADAKGTMTEPSEPAHATSA